MSGGGEVHSSGIPSMRGNSIACCRHIGGIRGPELYTLLAATPVVGTQVTWGPLCLPENARSAAAVAPGESFRGLVELETAARPRRRLCGLECEHPDLRACRVGVEGRDAGCRAREHDYFSRHAVPRESPVRSGPCDGLPVALFGAICWCRRWRALFVLKARRLPRSRYSTERSSLD
jgi:hypothetical protein